MEYLNNSDVMNKQDDVNPAAEKSKQVYEATPVVRDKHAEGLLTRVIEQQTTKLPSDFFLWCSLGSMGISLYLELSGRHKSSRFIGMWAPSLLIMGVYDKLVKISGSR
jgi:hypothetical protein